MPYTDIEKQREYQRNWARKHRADLEVREKIKSLKRAWLENNRWRTKSRRQVVVDWIDNYKREHPCSCGESHPACLDFHHLDTSDKKLRLAKMTVYSLDAVKAEVAKCVVMCANCHRKLHWQEKQDKRKGIVPE